MMFTADNPREIEEELQEDYFISNKFNSAIKEDGSQCMLKDLQEGDILQVDGGTIQVTQIIIIDLNLAKVFFTDKEEVVPCA